MYLPIAIIAYILNAVAVSIDKALLNKAIPDPLIYIFYLSLLSCLALFALPFTKIPSTEVIILASTSTILWTMGAYFMFSALKTGQVSRVIPVIGTINPLILFTIAIWSQTITHQQIWAVILLVFGMIFIIAQDLEGKITKKEIIYEVLSASFFAFSYLILKETYTKESVFTVLIWSRIVLIPIALVLLSIPFMRSKILPAKNSNIFLKTEGVLLASGQFCGALSQILILIAISMANPALVNSIAGIQYIFLFIIAVLVFKEKYSLKSLVVKICGIALIGTGLYLLTLPKAV
jgi:uncharacterized membrane protein